MVQDLKIRLIAQKPIKFNGIFIYQPSFDEIIEFGIDKYNMLMLPFLLDVDDFEIADASISESVDIFDILTLIESTLTMLLNSISFFCKTEEIAFDEQNKRLYIGDNYIDKNNFKEFSEIILKINAKQKQQREKPPKNMTEKQRDIWNKLQEGRQRAMEKSQIDLADLINVCQFGGEYYISKDDILNWTMWNITRCYKNIIGKSNFRESFEVYCVTGEDKLIKNQHWTDLIKIENNKEET
jgi:hypothetical protein